MQAVGVVALRCHPSRPHSPHGACPHDDHDAIADRRRRHSGHRPGPLQVRRLRLRPRHRRHPLPHPRLHPRGGGPAVRPLAALVVNTTSDALAPGAGLLSLREAIAFNNTSPAGNAPITFDSGAGRPFNSPQTITLAGTQLELSNTIGTASITGPAAGLTIDGAYRSRVFQV